MTSERGSEAVINCFNAAEKDAQKLHPKEGKTKLAICFVTLNLPPKTNRASAKKNIAKLIKILMSTKADAVAWCFPLKARLLLWEKNRRCFPGIAVLIRKVTSSK